MSASTAARRGTTPQLDRIAPRRRVRRGRHRARAADAALPRLDVHRPPPWQHGIRDNISPADVPPVPLLAEVFEAARLLHRAPSSPRSCSAPHGGLGRGFDVYGDRIAPRRGSALHRTRCSGAGDETLAEAIAWLEANHQRRPRLPVAPPLRPPRSRTSRRSPTRRGSPGGRTTARSRSRTSSWAASTTRCARLGLRDADPARGHVRSRRRPRRARGDAARLLRLPDDAGRAARRPRAGDRSGTRLAATAASSTCIRRCPSSPACPAGGGAPRGPQPGLRAARRRRAGGAGRLRGIAGAAAALRLERPARAARRALEVHPGPAAGAVRPRGRSGRATQPRRGGARARGRLPDGARQHARRRSARRRARAAAPVPVELLEKLGALGYVGGAAPAETSTPGADPKDKIDEFRVANALMRDGHPARWTSGDFAAQRRPLPGAAAPGHRELRGAFLPGPRARRPGPARGGRGALRGGGAPGAGAARTAGRRPGPRAPGPGTEGEGAARPTRRRCPWRRVDAAPAGPRWASCRSDLGDGDGAIDAAA